MTTRWPARIFLVLGALLLALGPAPGAAVPPPSSGPGELQYKHGTFHAPEAAGVAVIRVEREAGDDGGVSVSYSTADGTAIAGQDYVATSGVLTWADGDHGHKTFTVVILGDALPDAGETVQLILSDPTGGAVLGDEHPTAVLVIEGGGCGESGGGGGCCGESGGGGGGCEEGPGVLRFERGAFHGIETAGMAIVTVKRRHGETGDVGVSYATADGTAVAGQDYVATSGLLAWADGDDEEKSFIVELLDDGLPEGGETVQLLLSDPTGGATLDPHHSTAMLVITGAEPACGENEAGVFEFTGAEFQVIENEPFAVIGVARSDGDDGAVSVDFAATDGTATGGSDYTPVNGTLGWLDGESGEKTFQVPILQDELPEETETILLALSNPTGGAEIDDDEGAAILNLLDDDAATEACSPSADTLCLAGGRFAAEISYRTPNAGTGHGHAVPLSGQSGLFWFFDQANAEMLIKVIDGCQVPGLNAYWVFYAATTNVDFTMTVTDTETGVVKQYNNPYGLAAKPVQDVFTFRSCP